MNILARFLWILAAGAWLVVTCCPAEAGEKFRDLEKKTLQGIPDISVVVEELPADIAALKLPDLNKDTIRAEVEARLKTFGILLSDKPASPYLSVSVAGKLLNEQRALVYVVQVEFLQGVTVLENRTTSVSATWRVPVKYGLITVTSTRTIRDAVVELVDAFARDYMAANPKGDKEAGKPKDVKAAEGKPGK